MKIYVTGPSGAGTTTLAQNISEILSLKHYDSDDLFWVPTDPPYSVPREGEELREKITKILIGPDDFILSGDILNWGLDQNLGLTSFTHGIFLYIPWEIRKMRLESREAKRFTKRILPGGDMHEKYQSFLNWAQGYETGKFPGRSLQSQKNFINLMSLQGTPTLKIENDLPLSLSIKKCLKFLAQT